MSATPSLRPKTRRLRMAASSTSQICCTVLCGSNSSGIIVIVAPAACPIDIASHPALRPMQVIRYQRPVVCASRIRFLMSSVPSSRAVENPNVAWFCGSGRSLSIVLGT